jgi:hypothetical protein
MHGADEKCIKILFGKRERRGLLGTPTPRWEDNIRMYLTYKRWIAVDWMHLAQDRDQWRALVNMVSNLRVP